ncbi:MAG: PspA/IM30 family protein, partial [Streptomycetales bacterium]
LDELAAAGALEDASGTARDDISVELERMSSQSDVESQLAQMKQEVAAGEERKELGGGPGTGAAKPSRDTGGEER